MRRRPLAAQTSTLSSRVSALLNSTGCFGMHLFKAGHQAEQGGQSGGDLPAPPHAAAGMFVLQRTASKWRLVKTDGRIGYFIGSPISSMKPAPAASAPQVPLESQRAQQATCPALSSNAPSLFAPSKAPKMDLHRFRKPIAALLLALACAPLVRSSWLSGGGMMPYSWLFTASDV